MGLPSYLPRYSVHHITFKLALSPFWHEVFVRRHKDAADVPGLLTYHQSIVSGRSAVSLGSQFGSYENYHDNITPGSVGTYLPTTCTPVVVLCVHNLQPTNTN
jgi:hypothetical protein